MLNSGLAAIHLFIVTTMTLGGFFLLKNGRYSFLTVALLFFIIMDSYGLGLAPLIHLKLPYLEYTYIPLFEEPDNLHKLYLSHWIFLFISFCFILFQIKYINKAKAKNITISVIWAYLFFAIGILLSIKFFIFGPGFDIVMSTRLKFDTTVEAIAHRSVAKRMMELGQGAYLASLAAKIFFPISALIFLFNKQRLLFFISSIFPLVYSLSTRQKGPIIVSLFMLIAGLVYSNGISKKKIIYTSILILFLSVLSYMYSFGLGLLEAAISTFGRVFIVPGLTEYNYYAVFPEVISFRGLGTLLKMPLGAWGETGVTIYDVAYAATRNVFSSNANFLAIAWSAAGYVGILVVSLLFCICLSILDCFARNIPFYYFLIVNIFMLNGYLSLISDSLGAFLSSGGFFLPLILIIISKSKNPLALDNIKQTNEAVGK